MPELMPEVKGHGTTTPRRRGGRRRLARGVGAWLVWWVLLMSFWVILDDSLALDELLAGAGAAALGASLAELVGYQAATWLRIRVTWLGHALSLPGEVVRDTVIVFMALWRHVAHGDEPASCYREVPVCFGPDTSEGKARRALLVGGRSVAPNTLALGIDAERDVMVVHQLVASDGEAVR